MNTDAACPATPFPQRVASTVPLQAATTEILWQSAEDPRIAARLAELDADLGQVRVSVDAVESGVPQLDVDESYTLETLADGVRLQAATTWGALHAVSTLRQICTLHDLSAHGLSIEDHPRFSWRGLLVDVARHFIPLDVLLRVVDGMALLKMNVLHLHLTDDQGFRFPSAAFPELVSDEAYGVAELSMLVTHAADRGIRVVPEIDVPGHVQSWLAARPDWGLHEIDPTRRFGVHKACLNPNDEAVYAALTTLFKEVAAVFPDDYVHIGGDEVHPAWWSEDAALQAFIEEQGLGDVRGLQAYFNRRVHGILERLGKRVVGWDEVLHPDMPKLTVQNWRGATTRDRALADGLACIVSSGFYLDLFYPADVHYRYDIALTQAELTAQEDALQTDLRFQHVADGMAWTRQWRDGAVEAESLSGRLLGGEACLWSELVDGATLETRLFSRLPAVAERFWSAAGTLDADNFYARLGPLLAMPPFVIALREENQLQTLGLNAAQIAAARYLEPVKWYARLLGETALAARIAGSEMPQARPYTCDTPLNRVVDFLSPESLSARALRDMEVSELEQLAAVWTRLEDEAWPEDVAAPAAALAEIGRLLARYLQTGEDVRGEIGSLYGPHGEYMIAAVPPLLERLAGS